MVIVHLFLFAVQRDDRLRWIDYCLSDVDRCPMCFGESERDGCVSFLEHVELEESIGTSVNELFGSRRTQFGYAQQTPVILKHLSNDDKLNQLLSAVCDENSVCLANSADLEAKVTRFVTESKPIDGIQRCENASTERFERVFNTYSSRTIFWAQVYINPEQVVLKALRRSDQREIFARIAPILIDSKGFVLVESNAGRPLHDFYAAAFEKRLAIARNLLLAAEAFSHGIDGMR